MNGQEFKNRTFRQWAIEKTRGIFTSNKITGADISAIFKYLLCPLTKQQPCSRESKQILIHTRLLFKYLSHIK